MALLQIQMFGVLTIRDESGPLGGVDWRKPQELLCYLILHRSRSHQREALAGLLWAETTTSQSRANLRKAIWRLQACLRPRLAPGQPLLLSDADRLQIHPLADIWSDIELLSRAYLLAEGRPGERLEPAEAEQLARAVDFYRGALLEGWYEEWCLYERERFQQMYLVLLDKLMGYCEVSRQFERGLAYGRRALCCEPAHEQIHRRLMRLHFGAGDRTAALRQFERCAAALRDSFDLAPSECTTALYEQIRQVAPPAASADLPPLPAPEIYTLVDNLRQMHEALGGMQTQIRGHLRALEDLIGARE